ncbi:CBS domain-containing protein [Corynebacterium bouchesdurhonense]|uniref:CBS domain-containing protein n=1 Tax=Corynebacterium bouchesdurhonense TaxID=1720192 RepID=UPI000830F576|nr:CBS domain-containing protein [Corynebacterium bouchesdurhonense]
MNHPTPTRAVEFLAAFNTIEAFLREQLGAKKSDSFKWMTTQAAHRGILSREQADDLKEYAELRNAISHSEYRDFKPIAEPLRETVDNIAHLRDSLLRPTLALEVVGQGGKVVTFSPDDRVRDALAAIRETGHTQFPIYEGGACVGLLTANSIVRWVAEGDTVGTTTIDAALELSGRHDQAVFLPRTATAAAAVDALSTPFESGARPRLVIITEHGRADQRPIAVLGPTDIPALTQAI